MKPLLRYFVLCWPCMLVMVLAWLSEFGLYIAMLPAMMLANGTDPFSSLPEKYGIFGTIAFAMGLAVFKLWVSLQKERDARISDLKGVTEDVLARVIKSLDGYAEGQRQMVEVNRKIIDTVNLLLNERRDAR